MDDRTRYAPQATLALVALTGPQAGRRYPLAFGVLTIGRSQDNDIVLDAANHKASRHHAKITVAGQEAVIEDLGSTNKTYVNGEALDKAALAPGARILIGDAEFALQSDQGPAGEAPADMPASRTPPKAGAKAPGDRPARPRISRTVLLATLLGVGLLTLVVMIFSGSDQEPAPVSSKAPAADSAESAGLAGPGEKAEKAKAEESVTAGAPGERAKPGEPAARAQTGQTGKSGQSPPATSPKAEQAKELSRQAMFFYNSGKLKQAIEQWEAALGADPDNEQARKLMVRAEGELDLEIDRQYRQALVDLRLMRRDAARNALRFVAENARDPSDERVVDAVKKLRELDGQ